MTENQRVERLSSLNRHANSDCLENQEQEQRKNSLQLRAVLSNHSLLACSNTFINRMQNEHINLQPLFDTTNEKFTLNDYVLIEENDFNDSSYGTAYNRVKNEFFYWKKFDKKDYMKKLEAYFLMENSTNIYKFAELISNQTNVYILFDVNYGDLHSYMKEKKRLSESEARFLFEQCVQAVDECHQNGIIVRDIKLKKFVFTDSTRTKLALANLEDCIILDDDAQHDLIQSQQGCPAYVSPEVLNSQHTPYSGRLSDSWSLGVILYALLVGRYPFHDQTILKTFAKITRGKFQIPPSSGLSLDARILIRSLMRYKPDERLLPSEIMSSNWFRQAQADQTSLSQAVNHMTSLHSNMNSRISSSVSQRKPLEAALSAPLTLTSSSSASRYLSINPRSQLTVNERNVPGEI